MFCQKMRNVEILYTVQAVTCDKASVSLEDALPMFEINANALA